MEVMKCAKVNQLMLKKQAMIDIHDKHIGFQNFEKKTLQTKTVEIWAHNDTWTRAFATHNHVILDPLTWMDMKLINYSPWNQSMN